MTTAARTLAIGDVHGCAAAFDAVLDAAAPRAGDVVVTLGDYVDRGPDSRGVLDRLVRWPVDRPEARLVPLRGNHEVMMLDARKSPADAHRWLSCGGEAALLSYAGRPGGPGQLEDVPAAHWTILEDRLLGYFETDTHFFVHANAYADRPLDEQPDFMLYWESWHEPPPPHENGKVMVCGHTAQRSGFPRVTPYAICLDTAACRGQWLTCLCCETGELWQANQAGETRSLWLDEV